MRYRILLILFLYPLVANAQFTAPGSKTVRYSSYSVSPGKRDPIFIWCNNAAGTQKGELRAVSPSGTGPFTFAWYRWNPVSNSFSDNVKTESGNSSSIQNLDDGGYRVVISGGFDTTMTAWVNTGKPHALAQLQNRTCDYVALKGTAAADTFYYYNPSTFARIRLPNAVKFLWSSDPASVIPFPDFAINPQTFTPPLEDVTYNIQVTDSFGCISNSSFFYESIHVKAEFTADPVKGEAPLEVTFTDKSVRANYKYRWNFGEKTPDGKKVPDWVVTGDSLEIFKEAFTHKFFRPGEYSVNVVIESNLHCVDSFRLEPKIVVDPSDLEIPNVFSPDGDGINDNFIVEAKSLMWLTIDVFSRSGKRVYHFEGEGDRLASWTGWDGNVNNTSVKAAPGVYYYIVRARGWDDVKYDSREQRGFVYLYR